MTVVSKVGFRSVIWHKGLALVLAFWISSSIFLDFVIMPSLFAAGMMSQPDFAAAGYSIFWIFNRLELLCAALIMTGILARNQSEPDHSTIDIILSSILLITTLVCTYLLAPQMSVLGLNLNLFEPATVPNGMNQLHVGYWLIELCKLTAAGWLLKRKF
jgi:hypothetical protein